MKEKYCCLPKQSGFYWVIFFIFCLAVAGFFYFQVKEPEDVWYGGGENNIKVSVENLDNGKQSVKNDTDGYQLIINEGVVVDTKSNTLLFYEDEDKTLPDYTFTKHSNKKDLTLEEWLDEYNRENWLMFFDEKEKINLNDRQFYRIREEGDPTTFSYFFSFNKQIFVITTQEGSDYNKIISTFSSLKLN